VQGLNGVDNGRIWFRQVRVPRDALLDRYASVGPDGRYSSPIPSVSARFGTPGRVVHIIKSSRAVPQLSVMRAHCGILRCYCSSACISSIRCSLMMALGAPWSRRLHLCGGRCVFLASSRALLWTLDTQLLCAGVMVGGLTTGRMLIAQAAVDSLKIGVTIALRYAHLRPQFGNTPIMNYVTHQFRLLPVLADAYALHLGLGHLKVAAFDRTPATAAEATEHGKRVHVMSAGLKAAATWRKVEGLQHCRECCGGQGFLAANKIGPMAVDTNVDVTFEGDNTVMMQQVAKALVDTAVKAPPSAHPTPPRTQSPAGWDARSIAALLQFRCVSGRCVLELCLAEWL
jgi:Acyl-CoA dehydrogenase, C-terminal domain